uniref:EOG090X0GPG n=1 Tax=Lynceus sp. MCZ IZ 141354 TaxID=1930659 RepID=A0A9N6WUJ6_9CRUS|nr:EOG090X0GPG [Lynceus sp. MCZ IZ 141354]
MSDKAAKKRKTKAYYIKSAKQARKNNHQLCVGLKGFLCTCNSSREKDCVKEAYNVLNEYSDQLYGPEFKTSIPAESDDVEAELKAEVKELNEVKVRRFQVVDSGAKGCVFIKTSLENPLELMEKIIEDIRATGKQKTRSLLRMLPIELTCKAYCDDILKAFTPYIERIQPYKTFAIIFKVRNNSVSRDDIVLPLSKLITEKLQIKADLANPECCVIVDIMRTICCISIAPHFHQASKYNLVELAIKSSSKEKKEDEKKDEKNEDEKKDDEKNDVEDKKLKENVECASEIESTQ